MARRTLLWFLIPFAVVFGALALVRAEGLASADEPGFEPGTARQGRVVFVMVDSLGAAQAEDPKRFPTLARLRPRALWGRIAGCLPASTVACTRTMFEGSNAGYVASLDNFAARRAGAESFPNIAHAAGLRVAVASDHTFTQMLGRLEGPRIEFATAGIPVYGWDEEAHARAREWLSNDVADVLLIHLVDLDKASHSPGPASARYATEVRDADAALAGIAAALGPRDSLIVAGDHGHDEYGNHTPDPGYLALGPVFSPGRRDIEQATVALLLSAAAATPLPAAYDGEVPSGALRVAFGGSAEREATIRARVKQGREQRRGLLRRQTLGFLPGLAVAAAALGALFPWRGRRWLPALALLLSCALCVGLGYGWASVFRSAFWLGPTRNLVHYLGLFLFVGGAAAVAARRVLDLAWHRAAAAGLVGFPLLVHLTGDDYFGSPRVLSRVLPVAVLLLVVERLRRREALAFAAVGASGLATVLAELRAPADESLWLGLPFAGLSGLVLWLLSARRGSPMVRALLAAVPLLLVLGMRHAPWATLLLAALGVAVAVVTRDRSLPAPLRGLIGAAAVVAGFWASLGSLRFERVRFEFALAWLPTLPNEALLALLATPLTVLKYALVVALPLALAPLEKERSLRDATAFFVATPSLSAVGFVAGASLAGGSRYNDTAIQEASLCAAIALLTLLVLAIRVRSPAEPRPTADATLTA